MPRGRPRQTAVAAAPAARPRRANNRPQVPFAYKLALNQWLLSLFNVKRFKKASDDKFFVFIEMADPKFSTEKTRELLQHAGASSVEVVED